MLHLCSLAQPEREDWTQVIDLAQREPLSCACVDRYGWSPLFLALYNSAPDLAVIALLDARPNSVFAQTPFCDNAFHLAARYDASAVVICALADAAMCPDLTASLNSNGQSALHVAAELGASGEALVALLLAAPKSALLTTRQGTALHIAIKHQAEEDEVATLVEHGAEAVTMVDGAWRSPLHVAIRSGASPAIVRLLCLANSSVAAMCDKFGQSALHTVVARRQRRERSEDELIEIVVQLIESSPASRTAHDSSGRTPYDIAVANQCTESLLQLLREPVLAEAADDVASKSNARLSPPPPPPPPPSPPGDTPPLPSPLDSADVIVEAVGEVETVEAVEAEATEVVAAKVE